MKLTIVLLNQINEQRKRQGKSPLSIMEADHYIQQLSDTLITEEAVTQSLINVELLNE